MPLPPLPAGYQLDSTTVPPLPAGYQLQPPPETETIGEQAASALKDVGIGAVKGFGHTVAGTSRLLNKIPYVGETLAPKEGIQNLESLATPTNTPQKLGYYGEQAAEFMLPGSAEEAAAAKLAPALVSAGKLAGPLSRIATGALATGAVNKLQGGDFSTGALAGAGIGTVGEAAKAAAPSVAESALGISRKMRMHGKTPGEAILNETSAVRPLSVAEQASQKATQLTGELEAAARASTVPASTQAATDVVADAMAQARSKNNKALYDKLNDIYNQLAVDQFSGQAFPTQRTAEDILNAKRGINDLINSWTVDERKGVQKVLPQVYHALDSELDRTVVGAADLNQRISSLIPVARRGQAVSEGAGLPQQIAHRVAAAHTGALAGAGVGAGIGYQKGGTEGAVLGGLTGLVLPELLVSPTTQMTAARVMNSPSMLTIPRAAIPTLRPLPANLAPLNLRRTDQ